MFKINKLCRKKGYNLHATHFLWFLGGKRSEKCDLYIETANEIFAIKLFGMPRRRSVLVFKGSGEYFIRTYIYYIPIDGKSKPMPRYDFRYKNNPLWELKTLKPILLVNPVTIEIRRQSKPGSEVVVGAGDMVNGMEIDSLAHLLRNLESAV